MRNKTSFKMPTTENIKHIVEISYQSYPSLKEFKCLRCSQSLKENLRYVYVPDFVIKAESFIKNHLSCGDLKQWKNHYYY